MQGETKLEWTEDEDRLLGVNEGILVRWRGREEVERRKAYLGWQSKGKIDM